MIDRTVAVLCQLALNSLTAADFLCEQLEALDECLDTMPGGELLKTILIRKPDPESVSARQAFLMTLPRPEQLALSESFAEKVPENPVESASDSVAFLLARFYQQREGTLRSKLNDPSLSVDEMKATIEEVKELQVILRSLDQRF